MGAHATASTPLSNYNRLKCLEVYSNPFKRTFIKTGTTEGEACPGCTGELIDYSHTHPGLLHAHPDKRTCGADIDTFHAEIAGDGGDINQGCTGKNASADIKQSNAMIWTDFNAPTATNTLTCKYLFGYSSGRPEAVGCDG